MGLKDMLFGSEEENQAAADQFNHVDQGEITTDMLISEIIGKHPMAAQFLMDCGMECIFCPASQMETLEQACSVHGIDSEEICAALNEQIKDHNA